MMGLRARGGGPQLIAATETELAAWLGISTRTLSRMRHKGALPDFIQPVEIGAAKRYLVLVTEPGHAAPPASAHDAPTTA